VYNGFEEDGGVTVTVAREGETELTSLQTAVALIKLGNANGDDKLTIPEAKTLLASMVEVCDTDGNGMISAPELAALFADPVGTAAAAGRARAAKQKQEAAEGQRYHNHAADLPGPLRDFKIICDHPAVQALTTGAADARREGLENAVAADPTSTEKVAALATYLLELNGATQTAIETYLKEDGLFKRAYEALDAGNSSFMDVYTAVWQVVQLSEPKLLLAYQTRVTAVMAKLPKTKQQQTSNTVAEVFRDGASVQLKFAKVMREKLYGRLKKKWSKEVEGIIINICPTLKKTTRLQEKTSFAGTAAGISDVVRGMLTVKSLAGVLAVLEVLLELEAENVIKLVRLKDRFCSEPSGGGWRDLMANMTLVGDPTKHICELQVVHEKM